MFFRKARPLNLALPWLLALTTTASAAGIPYGNNTVPGVIRAVDFDQGGEGVGYHDNDPTNKGGYYRLNEGVDIGIRGSGTLEVMMAAGEYLNFTVNIAQSARYEFKMHYSFKSAVNGKIAISVDGGPETIMDIPFTAGHGNFITFTLPEWILLEAGQRTIQLKAISNGIYVRNLQSELKEIVQIGKKYYLNQYGSGLKDGSSFENAFPISVINTVLNTTMVAGDTLFIAGGVYASSTPYNMSVTSSGEAGKPKRIVGVDLGQGLPLFKGFWSISAPSTSAKSWSILNFGSGASYWEVEGIHFQNYMHGVMANGASNLKLKGIHAHQVREGFVLTHLDQTEILESSVVKYAKRGIRIKENVRNFLVRDAMFDGTVGDTTWRTEAFPFGISAENPSTSATLFNYNLTFDRVVAKNNLYIPATSTEYANGDGYSFEGSVRGVKFLNSAAYDNTDGGWDDKSQSAYYENCVALRNKRNFRIWNGNPVPTVMRNVLGAYSKRTDNFSTAGLWSQGIVEVYNSTFFANEGTEVILENNGGSPSIKIYNSILSDQANCGRAVLQASNSTLQITNSIVCSNTNPDSAPQLKAPSMDWMGNPADAFHPVDAAISQGYR